MEPSSAPFPEWYREREMLHGSLRQGNTYEHYQVVWDGSAWICLADRQCTGPTANRPTTTINPQPVTRRSPAVIGNTIPAAATRHRSCCANPPAHTPITASNKRIHKLHAQLQYAGHELPGCLRSGDRL